MSIQRGDSPFVLLSGGAVRIVVANEYQWDALGVFNRNEYPPFAKQAVDEAAAALERSPWHVARWRFANLRVHESEASSENWIS